VVPAIVSDMEAATQDLSTNGVSASVGAWRRDLPLPTKSKQCEWSRAFLQRRRTTLMQIAPRLQAIAIRSSADKEGCVFLCLPEEELHGVNDINFVVSTRSMRKQTSRRLGMRRLLGRRMASRSTFRMRQCSGQEK
jgi:hypothetical protein